MTDDNKKSEIYRAAVERGATHQVKYSSLAPSPQNSLTIFEGEWSSSLPGAIGSGQAALFEDPRISWLVDKLGSVNGWRVLELGPLEGGHTYMLENCGANVVAIENNHNAFLCCLIIKNLFNLRSEFLLGDFSKSFAYDCKYDLVIASGVLYHMTEPITLIQRIATVSDRVFFWTHYFDPEINHWCEGIRNMVGCKWRPDLIQTVNIEGVDVRIVPQIYGEALGWPGFCGGPDIYSNWIYRDDIPKLLNALGFVHIEIAFDMPDHQNGPAFCILAQKQHNKICDV